jgi:hypothetical protein
MVTPMATDINVRSLKSAKVGDSLVIVKAKSKYVGLYVVESRKAARGCRGSTNVTLRNVVSERTWTLRVGATIGHEITTVRRVSKGTRVRTSKKGSNVELESVGSLESGEG